MPYVKFCLIKFLLNIIYNGDENECFMFKGNMKNKTTQKGQYNLPGFSAAYKSLQPPSILILTISTVVFPHSEHF